MASIRPRGTGYQVLINRKGHPRISGTFDTMARAKAWAIEQEAEILAGKRGEVPPNKTFADLLTRYRDEVSIEKRGELWETRRINQVLGLGKVETPDPIARVKLKDLSDTHVIAWRDRRLQVISSESVRREWNLLSAACTLAVKEWKWLRVNPFSLVSRPEPHKARTRRPSQQETDKILYCAGADAQCTPVTTLARVGFAWLFAIETGMRCGEICSLTWPMINGSVARLPITKNGHPRDVPLSNEARRLLSLLPRLTSTDSVFQLRAEQVDALWRKACERANILDLHFHDSRREALSRMAAPRSKGGKGLDVMTLAKISGHRDLRILQNTYYAPDMEDVATLLD